MYPSLVDDLIDRETDFLVNQTIAQIQNSQDGAKFDAFLQDSALRDAVRATLSGSIDELVSIED